MKRLRWAGALAGLALACLLLGACDSTATAGAPPATAASEYDALMNAFRAAKITIYNGGDTATQQFLSVSGKKVFVGGQALEIYEYPTAAAATKDSHNIDTDACLIHMLSGGTSMVSWPGKPHLYKKDMLLVIYVGTDYSIIDVLVAQLGPQFAGS